MNKTILLLFVIAFAACNNNNKTTEEKNEGNKQESNIEASSTISPMLGSFTGAFGDNKISVVISRVTKDSIEGSSVVAGNDRPFSGTYKIENGRVTATGKEPGDDKYDGVFSFTFDEKQKDNLAGSWTPNTAGTHGGTKTFNLNRRQFVYLKDVGRYPETSKKVMTEDDVAGYGKEDLAYMRNEIFARHGYCFKKKDLRMQFENQDWYVPAVADIKDALTDVEKKNIAIIKRFEKYIEEMGDEYGR